jgi:alpha-L-rhamnosidase
MPGWDTVGFDASSWDPAQDCGEAGDTPELVQKTAPGVRVKAELKPVKILSPQKDVYIWDFGQNITGTFRVKLKGIPGRLYTFRTAEMLNDNGTLYTLNYRSALSCDHYICAGGEEFTEYMPRFTFHGFRYLQIEGFQFAEKIPAEDLDVTAIVLYSDLEKSGDFECGDQLINRLYQNVVWGQRGNFLEIPTDCPQRDERLGWTGDSQLFAPMAVFNMECAAFYRKYLRDIREGMTPEGASPSIAPAILNISDGAAGWGDAIILIPYTLYKQYGWKGILEENYVAMTRSIAFQLANSTDFIRRGKRIYKKVHTTNVICT